MKNGTPLLREAFSSQNTPPSDHFWKLGCRQMAGRVGAKRLCKSKCTKHLRFGPLLEVSMPQRCPTEDIISQLANESISNVVNYLVC